MRIWPPQDVLLNILERHSVEHSLNGISAVAVLLYYIIADIRKFFWERKKEGAELFTQYYMLIL